MISGFLQDEEGITSIEYALIASLEAVGIIVGLSLLRNSLGEQFLFVGKTIHKQKAGIVP